MTEDKIFTSADKLGELLFENIKIVINALNAPYQVPRATFHLAVRLALMNAVAAHIAETVEPGSEKIVIDAFFNDINELVKEERQKNSH